jgi:hypothetical protein
MKRLLEVMMRLALVAARDQLEEQVGALAVVNRQIANLVNDEKLRLIEYFSRSSSGSSSYRNS